MHSEKYYGVRVVKGYEGNVPLLAVFGVGFVFFERLFSNKTGKYLQEEFLDCCKKGSMFKNVPKQSDMSWLSNLKEHIRERRKSYDKEPRMRKKLKKVITKRLNNSHL